MTQLSWVNELPSPYLQLGLEIQALQSASNYTQVERHASLRHGKGGSLGCPHGLPRLWWRERGFHYCWAMVKVLTSYHVSLDTTLVGRDGVLQYCQVQRVPMCYQLAVWRGRVANLKARFPIWPSPKLHGNHVTHSDTKTAGASHNNLPMVQG